MTRLRLILAASISTGIVIMLAILIVVPIFLPLTSDNTESIILMLVFSIVDEKDLPTWCNELSSFLKEYDLEATVFITGRIAEFHPDCVNSFHEKVDIGSQTYSYINLTSIYDYTIQLEEVRKGKIAVDTAGNIFSKLFRAPYGLTDSNIYSILSRSGIVADFSYEHQYNKYCNGQFIKFDLIEYNGTAHPANFFLSKKETNYPIVIFFDNYTSVEQIRKLILSLIEERVRFANASTVTGLELTIRGVSSN